VSEDAIQAFYAMDVAQVSGVSSQVTAPDVPESVSPPSATDPSPALEALDDVSFVDDGEGEPLPAEGSIEADPAFAKPAEADLSAYDDLSISDDNDERDESDEENVTLTESVEQVVQVTLANANVFSGAGMPVSQQPTANSAVAATAGQPRATNSHPHAQDLPLIASREPLVVVLYRNGDARSDVAKLEAVHQTLCKYEGEQPFVILLRGSGKDTPIDFPNDTTRDCAELRAELTALLGAKCVQ
jgi:hypothetical protein